MKGIVKCGKKMRKKRLGDMIEERKEGVERNKRVLIKNGNIEKENVEKFLLDEERNIE